MGTWDPAFDCQAPATCLRDTLASRAPRAGWLGPQMQRPSLSLAQDSLWPKAGGEHATLEGEVLGLV